MSCVTGIPSAAKRQAILDAAIEAFLDSGYAAGVDDIAARAGVGKQTVYRHFGDKQALFMAAVTAARDRAVGDNAVRDNAALDGADDGRSSSPKDCHDPRRVLTRIGERILAMTLSRPSPHCTGSPSPRSPTTLNSAANGVRPRRPISTSSSSRTCGTATPPTPYAYRTRPRRLASSPSCSPPKGESRVRTARSH